MKGLTGHTESFKPNVAWNTREFGLIVANKDQGAQIGILEPPPCLKYGEEG